MRALRWVGPFLVVQLAALLFVLQPQLEEIEEQRVSLAKLKEEYLQKKRVAVNLDLARQQLRDTDTVFGNLLRELPNRVYRDFGDVLNPARSRGVRIEELRPEQEEIRREFYCELRIYLKASGRYHDLGRFAADLAAAPGSVRLQALSLDASPEPGRVTMAATLRIFRYLDDAEVEAQRRAAKGTKK